MKRFPAVMGTVAFAMLVGGCGSTPTDEARSACEAWIGGLVQVQGLERVLHESSVEVMDDRMVIRGQVDVDVPQDTRSMTYNYVCAVDNDGKIIEEGSNLSSGTG